jgi:hypothetical protein
VLEALPLDSHHHDPPRANLLAAPGEFATAGIWMGGAHSHFGHPIALAAIERAWVIDCAGDMPRDYRNRAARWFARVFADLDAVPSAMDAIRELAASVAAALASDDAPEHLYVVCQYGMNRSGLVAGLVLRELGVTGAGAVSRILAARPGALSNQAFRRLVEHSSGFEVPV